MAPLASWISLTSSWVMTMSRPMPLAVAGREHHFQAPLARGPPPGRRPGGGRGSRSARCGTARRPRPRSRTRRRRRPARRRSVASSGGRRRRHASPRSIAPVAARMPSRMWAPSNAGPDAQDVDARWPIAGRRSTISVLVPMSTPTFTASTRSRSAPRIIATWSAPTKPPMLGGTWMRASGAIVDPDVARPDLHGRRRGRHERRLGELAHGQSQEQVVHGGVADDAALGDLVPDDAGLVAHRSDQRVQPLAHDARQRLAAPGLPDRVGEPADDVLAVGDLRVHQRPRRTSSSPVSRSMR